MAETARTTTKSDELTLSERDILFECPSCGKSLLVDQAAEGLIVVCPQCHINVIVPPRNTSAPATVAPSSAAPPVVPPPVKAAQSKSSSAAEMSDMAQVREQLVTLGSKLKELQTQRTELTNRIASRLNEVNRDLVMMARLETSQQQLLSEWNKITAQLETASAPPKA